MLADVTGLPASAYAFNGHGTGRCAGVALPTAWARGDVLRGCEAAGSQSGGIWSSVWVHGEGAAVGGGRRIGEPC